MRKRGAGVSVSEICTTARIPRRTFYNWLDRYREHGLEGLHARSKAPHGFHRVSPGIVETVTSLRREKGWGPQLITGYL